MFSGQVIHHLKKNKSGKHTKKDTKCCKEQVEGNKKTIYKKLLLRVKKLILDTMVTAALVCSFPRVSVDADAGPDESVYMHFNPQLDILMEFPSAFHMQF